MNSQDFRNLQEAYMEVYSVDEELTGPRKERAQQLLRSKMTASGRAKPGQKQNIDQLMRVTSIRGDFRKIKPPIEGCGNKSKRRRGIDVPDTRKEQADLYDIILSHLIDEGYAETPEAAERIMVNMSEEWSQSIISEGPNYDKNRQRAAKRAAERNEARKRGQTGNVPGIGYVSPRPERETYRDAAGVERHTSGARMPQK